MKFKKLLFLAGLVAMNIVAMNPVSLFQGQSYAGTEQADQPIKKQVIRETQPIQTVLNPKEYDVQPWYGTTLAPLPVEKPTESAGEYYSEKPRPYPALPKGLFIEAPSTKEPDTRFYKDNTRAFLTPLSEEQPLKPMKPLAAPDTKYVAPSQPWEFSQELPPMTSPMPSTPPVQSTRPPLYSEQEEPITTKYADQPYVTPTRTELPGPMGPLTRPAAEADIQKRTLSPMATEKPLEKITKPAQITSPSKYAETPKLPVRLGAETEPMEKLAPTQPVMKPISSTLPVIVLGQKLQQKRHEAFEVTIINETDDSYTIPYQGQRIDLHPHHQETITIQKLEPNIQTIVTTSSGVGRPTVRETTQRASISTAKIPLVRTRDRKTFNIVVSQASNQNQMLTVATIQEPVPKSQTQWQSIKRSDGTDIKRTLPHEFARRGYSLYFPVIITLKGADLAQSTIEVTPTEQSIE